MNMPSSVQPKTESPYQKFTHKPVDESYSYGPLLDVPVILTDRNGCLLYENEGRLLLSIIAHDDVTFLKRYFAIDPQVMPDLFELSDGDEYGYEFAGYFKCAAIYGSLGVLQTLIEYTTKGLDKSIPIRLPFNPPLLNVAAQFGQVRIVQWLLDTQPLYASIDDRDHRGFTALAAAANLFETRTSPAWDQIHFGNSEAIMNLLLDHGACASDVAHPTNDGSYKRPSVLSLAAQWASIQLLERLIDGGADVHYNVTVSTWELDFGKQLGTSDKMVVNSLFFASLYANPNGVKTLVDRRAIGVDVADMVCSPDCVGGLPLHWAARNQLQHIPPSFYDKRAGNIRRTIEKLLDFAPTSVNLQDDNGNTALHYATRHFGKNGSTFTPIFELLCSRGADSSLRNCKNETPLHTLFQPHGDNGPIDIAAVSLLLSHGAKVTDVDEDGNTPLHIATRDWHFVDAASLLLECGADPAQKNLEQENALPKRMEYLLGSK
ncbi:hypothetical protein FLONG3_3593 [Fusarium longipes]|uniref:Uncharacterized protein n=1 Tax=Fusarium longipes TaxID=694270 RepID=A0A395T0P9_9HYPO|nr:hypothetical protein FLONG3_3593 [Fusarium longipes]